MKCFFDFRVKGSRLLAICLGYLICVWALMALWMVITVTATANESYQVSHTVIASGIPTVESVSYIPVGTTHLYAYLFLLMQLIYFVASIFLGFFLITECVKGLSFKGDSLRPHYKLGKYIGQVVKGLLLTIITLGIYYPWFLTKITRFFASGTTYRDQPFAFKGTGVNLFCIMTFVFFIPYIFLFGILYFATAFVVNGGSALFSIIAQLSLVAILLLLGLYLALVYRWMIDFTYGNSRIALKVSIPVTMLFMFIQIVLCILTAGLFVPIAGVMIYRYIVGNMRLVSESGEESAFGYQGRIGHDCLYVYGQALLTLITAGIYSPWMISKVGRRLISNTYLERPDVVTPTVTPGANEPAEAFQPTPTPEPVQPSPLQM